MEQELINTIERWEITGLLEGLPLVDKSELSMIYDNLTRILLGLRLDNDTEDILGTLCLLCARRVYKTRGIFDQEEMMDKLREFIIDRGITSEVKDDMSEISKLCVEFTSTYEDEETIKNRLTNDEYNERVNGLFSKVKEILMSPKMITYVDDKGKLHYSENETTKSDSRVWNQNQAVEYMKSVLNEMNRG